MLLNTGPGILPLTDKEYREWLANEIKKEATD